jgi:hypothetical protein
MSAIEKLGYCPVRVPGGMYDTIARAGVIQTPISITIETVMIIIMLSPSLSKPFFLSIFIA